MESNSALVSMAAEFSGLDLDKLIGGPLMAAAKANSAMALTQTTFLLDTCFYKKKVSEVQKIDGSAVEYYPETNIVKTPEKMTTPKIPEHDEYLPIIINMSSTRPVIFPPTPDLYDPNDASKKLEPAKPSEVKNVTTTFSLPLLTIIPLNSLAVETVDIAFEMEVKSSFAEDTSETKEKQMKGEANFEAKVGWGPFSCTIKGSASYDQKDSSTHNTHYQKSNSAKYTINVHAGQLPIPKGVNIIIEAFSKEIQPIVLKKEE